MKTLKNNLVPFFGLFFLAPIFISYSKEGLFGFDRPGGFEDHLWLITVPLSVFWCIYLVFKNAPYILKKSFIFIFILNLSLIIPLKIIYFGVDYQMLKVLTIMSFFIATSYAFQKYFDKKISIDNTEYAEKYFFIYPLLAILLCSLIGYYFFNLSKDSFISSEIKVYSYSQYFAYIFLLLLGSTSRSTYLFFLTLPLVLLISHITRNDTALVLTVILTCYFIIDKLIHNTSKRLLKNLTFVLILCLVLSYFTYMLYLQHYFPLPPESILDSFYYRKLVIDKYVDQFQMIQFVFPFLNSGKLVESSLHNEFLEVFNASGYIGFALYYYFIIYRFKGFSFIYRIHSIAFLLVIFLGGLLVEPTLHIYTAIVLSYFSGLYCSISNTMSKKSII